MGTTVANRKAGQTYSQSRNLMRYLNTASGSRTGGKTRQVTDATQSTEKSVLENLRDQFQKSYVETSSVNDPNKNSSWSPSRHSRKRSDLRSGQGTRSSRGNRPKEELVISMKCVNRDILDLDLNERVSYDSFPSKLRYDSQNSMR